MNKPIIIIMFCMLVLSSCKNNRKQPTTAVQTPKALTEDYDISSFKRGKDNLVINLYDELLDKDSSLMKLKKNYNALINSEFDSLDMFNAYNRNNAGYYIDANDMASGIDDSLIKMRIKQVLAESQSRYDTTIVNRHNALIKEIERKKAKLSDLYTVFRIERTLQMMESYQKKNLPSAKPLEGYSQKIDEVIYQLNKEAKKKK
ncbi:hypothetical protein CAP35_12810 [Chitinophagaceae bacterium IBVUCB1]|nr:hypothetical protein CAP35_12810 [Chitinophagaceae bacterium IBVUCB1]